MQDRIARAILKTLIYSDIFDFPLSKNELWKFLISKKVSRENFQDVLKNLQKKISLRDGFYCLYGREQAIKTRIKRKKESQKKIVTAKKIIEKLSRIPTIKFVGISGALSLENSEREDDIDLFVIVSKDTIWLTRLAMIILLLITGRYRRRNERQVSDKICLNMIIDESALSFPRQRQDLYTAHEIAQLMPVFERGDMYNKFIDINKWVDKFLPNALERGTKQNQMQNNAEVGFRVFQRIVQRFSALEWLARALQLWIIKQHKTTETISDHFLAFHPLDYKKKVLSEYKKRLREYEL